MTWLGVPPGTQPPPSSQLGAVGGAGLVAQLERLDALHRGGALTDDQYEAAKRAILGTAGGST